MRDGPDPSQSNDWALDVGPKPLVTDDMLDIDEDRPIPTARGVLTKAEIEALLRPNLPDDIGVGAPEPAHIQPRTPVRFDDKPVDPELKALRKSAGILAARLSLTLGQSTGVKAAIGLREAYKSTTGDLPSLLKGEAGAIACFGETESDVRALLYLPGNFADTLITRTCGGQGQSGRIADGWKLSAIDCALLMEFLKPLAKALGDDLHLQAIETDVPYVSSLVPAGPVSVAEYSAEAPGLRSTLTVITRPYQDDAPRKDKPASVPVTAIVTARIASLRVPLSRVTSLKQGSTLLLGLPADQPVELLSGDRTGPVAFEGQMGRKGNKVAVKITQKKRGIFTKAHD